MGGRELMALKKEKGARLSAPSAARVLVHPMGRGMTALTRSW